MPIYYWKRITPVRLMLPAFEESEYLSDDLKDLAGVLYRRLRSLILHDFNLRDAITLHRKANAYIQLLRCHELLMHTPASGNEFARLTTLAVEWERAYDAIPVGDTWWAMLSAARSRRKKRAAGGQEGVAKPPTLDDLRQRAVTPPATTLPLMSTSGTPMGEAHRDAPILPRSLPSDPVWGDSPQRGGANPAQRPDPGQGSVQADADTCTRKQDS